MRHRPSRTTGARPLLGAVLLTLWALALPARAEELVYAPIDRMTVRVIALQGIGLDEGSKAGTDPRTAAPRLSFGSGVLIGTDGLVLTASHIVKDGNPLAVILPGSGKALSARVIRASGEDDVAYVAISPTESTGGLTFPDTLPSIAVRETVDAVGYPLDARRAMPQSTRGIISGVLDDGRLQLGISVNPGNSGGPVVDESGNLLGMVTARGDPSKGVEGLAVAVPLSTLARLASGLSADATRRARSLALDEQSRRHADVLGALILTNGVVGSSGGSDGSGSPALEEALGSALGSDPSADILGLGAALYWNKATALIQRDPARARALFEQARALCRRARGADPTILVRSPFIGHVLDLGTRVADASPAAPEPQERETSPASGSVATGTGDFPTLLVLPGVGAVYPLYLGGDLHTNLHIDRWNLNASAGFGLEMLGTDRGLNTSYEAELGYAIASWGGRTMAKRTIGIGRSFMGTAIFFDRVEVPKHELVVVEGGVTNSRYVFDRACAQSSCLYVDPAHVSARITTFAFGVRYLYAHDGEYARENVRGTWSAHAHLLAFPVGFPGGTVTMPDETSAVHRGIFGATMGVDFAPFWPSWTTRLGIGYLPSISAPYLELGMELNVWALL